VDIVDLRTADRFLAVVADRIWRTWWRPSGATLEDVKAAFGTHLGPAPFPFTLVAHEGEEFLGTVSGIANDLAERPNYSPWIAALWVEPGHRNKGIAKTIQEQATASLSAMQNPAVYVCGKLDLRPFYERLGWRLLEEGVGRDRLTIFVRSAG
jgi:predicted N-acetyltransferase YhbS